MNRGNRIKLLFLLPAVIWVLCFTIFPLIYGVRLSFYNVQAAGPDEYVGVEKYGHFFSDEDALKSLAVTVVFVACGVGVQMAAGMALALLFTRRMPLRGLLRTLLTTPLFVTPMAAGLLFITIFNQERGLVTGLLQAKLPWQSQSHWALASVILVDIWQWTPFCFLIFLAALQGIPEDFYEAAKLETKNPWTVFRHITLPIVTPMVILVFLLRITEAFKVFDIPYTLTAGGPGAATRVLTMYAYQTGMRHRNYGYASSISVLLFALVMGLILVLFKRIRQAYQ